MCLSVRGARQEFRIFSCAETRKLISEYTARRSFVVRVGNISMHIAYASWYEWMMKKRVIVQCAWRFLFKLHGGNTEDNTAHTQKRASNDMNQMKKNNLEFFRIKANVWSAWRTILLLLLSCLYIWRYEMKNKNTRSKTVTITTNFTQCTHGSAYARHRTRVQTNDDEVSTHVYASAQQYNKTIAQKHLKKTSKMHWILYADCILLCNIKKK